MQAMESVIMSYVVKDFW